MKRATTAAAVVIAAAVAAGGCEGLPMNGPGYEAAQAAIFDLRDENARLVSQLRDERDRVEADSRITERQRAEAIDQIDASLVPALRIQDRLAGVESTLEDVTDDLGGLVTQLAPVAGLVPGYGPLIGLGLTTIGGFLSALHQRKKAAGQAAALASAARALKLAEAVGDGVIDLRNTPEGAKAKRILATMGPVATAAIRAAGDSPGGAAKS